MKNSTSSAKYVSCAGGVTKTPGAYGTVSINCNNICGSFAGTQFTYYGEYHCDYNSWGVDFTLKSGYGTCTDPC